MATWASVLGHSVGPKFEAVLTEHAHRPEDVVYAFRPRVFLLHGTSPPGALQACVLTDDRIVAVYEVGLLFTKVRGYGYELHEAPSAPTMRSYEFAGEIRFSVNFAHAVRPETSFLFRDRDAATRLHAQFSDDPAWAKLHRALDLLDHGPACGTESLEHVDGDGRAKLAAWFRERFAEADHDAVWRRRLALDTEITPERFTQPDFFWINACAAMAAFELYGVRDHPMVSTCAGWADNFVDPSDEDQARAVSSIVARFFG